MNVEVLPAAAVDATAEVKILEKQVADLKVVNIDSSTSKRDLQEFQFKVPEIPKMVNILQVLFFIKFQL